MCHNRYIEYNEYSFMYFITIVIIFKYPIFNIKIFFYIIGDIVFLLT